MPTTNMAFTTSLKVNMYFLTIAWEMGTRDKCQWGHQVNDIRSLVSCLLEMRCYKSLTGWWPGAPVTRLDCISSQMSGGI